MKQSKRITLCAICSALSAVVMLLGIIPYFTYAVPAVAGLFFIIPLIEIGKTYALASYFVTSVIVLFFPEQETKIVFILLFGFYPILKAIIEKVKSRAVEWVLKIGVFSACITLSYFAVKLLIGIDVNDFGVLGKYGVAIFLVLCYIAFVLYDIAISRITMLYIYRLRPSLKGILK